jgi:hypothetical protein
LDLLHAESLKATHGLGLPGQHMAALVVNGNA